ncbi:uncharacterized protein GLRG_03514 [Colletotrichum graminicola M1.001]|uniref:Uncharacterized protein n=1 Tax=Colletotrichum graminicola (strain M1.001 / M2 / FGSC 10212) TaxID=645133 RepID=E3QBN1_COLGM|nr:uncharacterized protein GLRG_03514 [Colletotrichum graminicola M1.001]EFQ28370.1 hypothetical protein GLRG_03514 [Colletotrichum graminicola M1.001]
MNNQAAPKQRVGMPLSRKLSAILGLSASVGVLLSSILALGFKMASYTSYKKETDGSPSGDGTKSSPIKGFSGWINVYPEHLVPVTRAPLVVAASIGLVIGLAATCLIAWSLVKKRAVPIAFTHQIAVLAANALVATITMIYMLARHSRSAHFDPEYEMTTASYDHGLFTLEAWACESPQTQVVVAKKQRRAKNSWEDDGWEY